MDFRHLAINCRGDRQTIEDCLWLAEQFITLADASDYLPPEVDPLPGERIMARAIAASAKDRRW
jgi:hypothetical protein